MKAARGRQRAALVAGKLWTELERAEILSEKSLNRLIWTVFSLIVIITLSFAVYYVVQLQRDRSSTPSSQLVQGLQKAINDSPRDPALRVRLAEVHIEQSNPKGAIEALNAALEIDRKYAPAYLVLGFAHMTDDNANEALKAFLKAVELRENGEYSGQDSLLEQGHFYAGVVYYRQKNYDEAIVHFKSAGRINKASSDTHMYIGKSYAAKQWYGKALQEYNIAITFDPKLAEAQYEIGKLYERQHDVVRAVEHYRLAKEAMPNRSEPQEALDRFGTQDSRYAQGEAYLKQKKYAAAAKELRIALAFEPRFVNAHYALGKALEATGQDGKATEEYALAAKYDPDLKDAKSALKRVGAPYYFRLGRTYEAKGYKTKAIGQYKLSLKYDPGHAGAAAALRRLGGK